MSIAQWMQKQFRHSRTRPLPFMTREGNAGCGGVQLWRLSVIREPQPRPVAVNVE